MRCFVGFFILASLASPSFAQDAWYGQGDRMAGYSIANPLGTGRVFIQKMLNVDPTGAYIASGIYTGPAASQLPASLGAKAGAASLSVVPDTDTPFPVVGNVASGVADAGAPVKIGGKYNATQPTFTDGQRADLAITSRGELHAFVMLSPTSGADSILNTSLASGSISGTANPTGGNNPIVVAPSYFNGTGWDRVRGDVTGTWIHTPPSTVNLGGGTIATSGGTAALTFTNTTDGEVINPSTGTLWASWGTPAVNGSGSFPILTGGTYRPPSRVAGTLTLLSTAASQTYTFNKF